ncbi:MAG TPA: hypothetical protein VGM23_12255 [Armatimonadota bacterium]
MEDTTLFGTKLRLIAFEDIREASVASLGKRSNYVITYYVMLKLTTGATYPLFFPAYYEGRWDRSVAEDRCRRLEEYLSHTQG